MLHCTSTNKKFSVVSLRQISSSALFLLVSYITHRVCKIPMCKIPREMANYVPIQTNFCSANNMSILESRWKFKPDPVPRFLDVFLAFLSTPLFDGENFYRTAIRQINSFTTFYADISFCYLRRHKLYDYKQTRNTS